MQHRRKAQVIGKYKNDMASYHEQCTTLAADGVLKKLWPKKPPHPLQGKKANWLHLSSPDSSLPHIPITHPHHTVVLADVIVDVDDGPEDSEYKDFEDELDI